MIHDGAVALAGGHWKALGRSVGWLVPVPLCACSRFRLSLPVSLPVSLSLSRFLLTVVIQFVLLSLSLCLSLRVSLFFALTCSLALSHLFVVDTGRGQSFTQRTCSPFSAAPAFFHGRTEQIKPLSV